MRNRMHDTYLRTLKNSKNLAVKLVQFKKYSYLCSAIAKLGCTRHNPNKFGFCSHLHDLCKKFAKVGCLLENLETCQKAGIVLLRFEQDENFKVAIPRRNVGQNNIDNQCDTKNVGQNVGQTKQAARYLKIMNTLLANRRTPQKKHQNTF